MYKRFSAVMFPIVTLLFIGTALWGYQEYQAKNAIQIQAENQYQRAFHDLTYHVDMLQDELGRTLAVHAASKDMHRKNLVNIWRLTGEAQSELNQLPLSAMPSDKTEEFLSRISNLAYRTSLRDMTKEPLTEDEIKTLKTLHTNSKEIATDLQKIQQQVMSDGLRWMDVASMKDDRSGAEQPILQGFDGVNTKVGAYSEVNWGPTVANIFSRRTVKMLTGKEVSEEEIMKKAVKLMKPHEVEPAKLTKNGNKTDYQTYTVRAQHKNGEGEISIDFTKQGVVLSYMDSRPVDKSSITVAEAKDNAAGFIKRHEFEEMKPVRTRNSGHIETITFVPVKEQVLIYPMQVQIKVALDTGDIVGVQAADYVYGANEVKDVSIKPKLTKQQALERVNSDLKVSYERLAVVKNEVMQSVLCYEIGGTMGKQSYRVYINADTGAEEMVESISM